MVDSFLYSAVTIAIALVSFLFGLRLSDKYHAQAEQEKKYALEKQYSRLLVGCDADDPVQPYIPQNRFSVPPEFVNRMQTNKSATLQVDKSQPI